MPRQSHGRPLTAASVAPPKSRKRKAAKSRGLNALQIAEKESPDVVMVRETRLGEIEDDDDSQRNFKRRKIGDQNVDVNKDGEGLGEESGSDLEGERWHVVGEGRRVRERQGMNSQDDKEGDADGREGEEEDEDEDSEIESDDAFNDSDEEMGRFVGFAFRGSGKPQVRRTGKAGEEDGASEGSDDESLGEGAVDLATVWDMDDADQREDVERKSKRQRRVEDSEEEMNGEITKSDGDYGSEEDEDMQSDISVSDGEDGDHTRLENFVQSLSRKSDEPKRLASTSKSTKISASDLMQYIKDPAQRQSLKILQNSERNGPEEYKSGIPGRLAAPLPKRQQDRLDRSAAYDESKKELGKWVETVKQNRRAEHLQFPLIDPNDPVAYASRQLGSTQGKPMNELERKVEEIMKENGMTSKGGDEAEREGQELEDQQVPFEVIQERRAELRKQRDLMFREEIRARRIKKIKSKAYRRVHRKEKAKEDEKRGAEDAANGLVDSDEEREKADRRRAEERMGRRHRESKWAKGMKEAGKMKWDDVARGAMEEAGRRDEELRRRIQGRNGEDEASESESEGYSEDDDGAALREKLLELENEGGNGANSKLGNMAFMRKAEAAKRARHDAEIHAIRRQLNDDGEEYLSEVDDMAPFGRQRYGANSGQTAKQPAKKPLKQSEFEERLSEDDFIGLDDETPLPLKSQGAPVQEPVITKPAKPFLLRSQSNGASESKPTVNRRTKNQPHIKTAKQPEIPLDDFTSSSESENEGVTHNEQTDTLGEDVFAGDEEIIRDFQKEKQEITVEEGDQIINKALPGWGSWTGAGVSKKAQARQKNKFLTTIKGVAPEKRQDSKLDRVIVNEKKVKKNGKYLATELPHPFESKQQYERSLRLPLGPEWTTKSTHQDATKPRVLIKQGVIRPMVRPQA